MARGDVKYSGGGGRGGGGSAGYDDEGRGTSKAIYERFVAGYTQAKFDCKWLFALPVHDSSWNAVSLQRLFEDTTYRHNLYDGLRKNVDLDSRVRRLVEKHCGADVWKSWHADSLMRYNAWLAELKERQRLERIAYDERQVAIREVEAREAERVRIEEFEAMNSTVELIAGTLNSDMYEVMLRRDVVGLPEGDWIDDVTTAYMGLGGFAEEEHHYSSGGINVQITLSLDCSNSMQYNHINEQALRVFVESGMSLKRLRQDYPDAVSFSAYEFSGSSDGKYSKRIGAAGWGDDRDAEMTTYVNNRDYDDMHWGEFEEYRQEMRNPNGYYRTSTFSGSDTYIAPLFTEIKRWEDKFSTPGAVRLDLVITDAVLEHPNDIREASQIQANRNGNLQTVLLNLLPENEWVNGSLPYKCVQYPVNKDNLAGVLRTVIAEFLSMYI